MQDGKTGNLPSVLACNEMPPPAIISPRDPASGQATGIQSPRDVASGQATAGTAQPGSQNPQYKVTFEDIVISSAKAPVAGATPSTGQGYAQDAGMTRHSPQAAAPAPQSVESAARSQALILRMPVW